MHATLKTESGLETGLLSSSLLPLSVFAPSSLSPANPNPNPLFTLLHSLSLQIESCQLESLQRRTTATLFLSSKLARSRLRLETSQVSTTSRDNRYVCLVLLVHSG